MAESPATTLPHIGCEELQRKLENREPFVLVDALPPMSYAVSRLPGAVNIPPEQVDELAPRRIPDRESEVVVYCIDPTCDASVLTGRRLVELGYTNVAHYAGGKKDWAQAGLPLEGGAGSRG
jgi:rhodanese-related sulfurtransferase